MVLFMRNYGNSYHKYSFLNPEDEAKMIAEWGGERTIREKYPAVWTAIQNTKEYEHEIRKNPDNGQSVEGYLRATTPNFINKKNTGKEIGEKKQGLFSEIKLRLEDGTNVPDKTMDVPDNEPVSKAWPLAIISGTINNMTDGHYLASYTKTLRNMNAADDQMDTDEIYAGTDFAKKRINTYTEYAATDFNGCLHKADYTIDNPDFTDQAGDVFVSDFMVEKPHSDHGNVPIQMLYDRSPSSGEVIDYSYTKVKDNAGREVKTCIPLKARLEFITDVSLNKNDILDENHSFLPNLMFGNPPKKHVEYNGNWKEIVDKAFSVYGNSLTIDFSKINNGDDWKSPMSLNNYTTGSYEIGRTVELHASFSLKLKYGGLPTKAPVSIVSVDPEELKRDARFYHTSNGYTAFIPKINIRWGCFAAGTQITMKDGSRKPVEEIRRGDILFTMDGPHAVREVYAGLEKYIIHICTEDNRTLKVTHTHPIVLEDGRMLQARSVRPGHRVMSKEGKAVRIKWVYECAYNGFVYNFEFSDGKEHVVEADGILAGEFLAQNSCKTNMLRSQVFTPQIQSLSEQFIAMHEASKKR